MKKLNFVGIGGATNINLGGNCCYLYDDIIDLNKEMVLLMNF